MKVILTSGHPPADLIGAEIGRSRFLHKPYVLSDLSARVREVLDE
jgi:DNA-binding response OmpR family regulator